MAIARREFIKYTAGSLVGTALLNSCRSQDRSQKIDRPNIIVLIADDLRWDCMGIINPIIQTPHLDRLAKLGTVYQNNFVTTSICPTSRASIFTGLYALRHGIWDFATALNESQWRNTYHYLLRKADYNTGFIGKWGLGDELPQDKFDYWAGFAEQGNYYTETRKEHLTSYLAGQAEEFIRQQKSAQNFCLTLSYKAPHVDDDPEDPFIPDTKFASQYQDIIIPRYGKQQDSSNLPEFLQNTEAQARYDYRFSTEELYQKSVKNYYRLVSGIDESIGRIVAAVEGQNFARDTYIIFTSDNGFFLGEKGLAGKWFGFEPAIRTPLIVTNIKQPLSSPKIVRDMSLNIDIAPTVLKLAEIEFKKDLFQGKDIYTEPLSPREWWFYEHLFDHPRIPSNIGIRSLQYKYLSFTESGGEMLFNLQQDPQETINLAQKPDYQNIIEQYRQRVTRSLEELA